MSIRGQACIVGAYEHPTRKAPDKSIAQLHLEVTFKKSAGGVSVPMFTPA